MHSKQSEKKLCLSKSKFAFQNVDLPGLLLFWFSCTCFKLQLVISVSFTQLYPLLLFLSFLSLGGKITTPTISTRDKIVKRLERMSGFESHWRLRPFDCLLLHSRQLYKQNLLYVPLVKKQNVLILVWAGSYPNNCYFFSCPIYSVNSN